LGVVCELVWL